MSVRFAAVLCAVVAACGGMAIRVSSPMTEADRRVFDDGADYIPDPAALDGPLGTSARDDRAERMRRADVVLAGVVSSLRLDRAADGRRSVRAVVSVRQRLFGTYGEHEIVLTAEDDEAGFDSLVGHERQLLERAVLVFVKWAEDGERVVARFHISPDGDAQRAAFAALRREP